jgi:hypothetical protein
MQLPVGSTIYDTERKCDFFIINSGKFPKGLIIECKWQKSKGSVDEKYLPPLQHREDRDTDRGSAGWWRIQACRDDMAEGTSRSEAFAHPRLVIGGISGGR